MIALLYPQRPPDGGWRVAMVHADYELQPSPGDASVIEDPVKDSLVDLVLVATEFGPVEVGALAWPRGSKNAVAEPWIFIRVQAEMNKRPHMQVIVLAVIPDVSGVLGASRNWYRWHKGPPWGLPARPILWSRLAGMSFARLRLAVGLSMLLSIHPLFVGHQRLT
jgi:hypothetical protein